MGAGGHRWAQVGHRWGTGGAQAGLKWAQVGAGGAQVGTGGAQAGLRWGTGGVQVGHRCGQVGHRWNTGGAQGGTGGAQVRYRWDTGRTQVWSGGAQVEVKVQAATARKAGVWYRWKGGTGGKALLRGIQSRGGWAQGHPQERERVGTGTGLGREQAWTVCADPAASPRASAHRGSRLRSENQTIRLLIPSVQLC